MIVMCGSKARHADSDCVGVIRSRWSLKKAVFLHTLLLPLDNNSDVCDCEQVGPRRSCFKRG